MKERVIENTQRKYKQSSLWAGTEPKQEKRNQMLQNVVFTGDSGWQCFLLIGLTLEGCFYGSTIDWYDQHVTLAETIRRTCMEENACTGVDDHWRRQYRISVCLLWVFPSGYYSDVCCHRCR